MQDKVIANPPAATAIASAIIPSPRHPLGMSGVTSTFLASCSSCLTVFFLLSYVLGSLVIHTSPQVNTLGSSPPCSVDQATQVPLVCEPTSTSHIRESSSMECIV